MTRVKGVPSWYTGDTSELLYKNKLPERQAYDNNVNDFINFTKQVDAQNQNKFNSDTIANEIRNTPVQIRQNKPVYSENRIEDMYRAFGKQTPLTTAQITANNQKENNLNSPLTDWNKLSVLDKIKMALTNPDKFMQMSQSASDEKDAQELQKNPNRDNSDIFAGIRNSNNNTQNLVNNNKVLSSLKNSAPNKFMQQASVGGIKTLFGDNTVNAPSTGNNFADKTAQFLGGVAAFGVNPGNVGGGMNGGSLSNGAELIGQKLGKPISKVGENILTKAAEKGLTPTAQKALNIGLNYGGNALKSGAEFAGINAGQAALQGGNNSQILKSAGQGFKQGALMGTAFKGIGDVGGLVLNKIKPADLGIKENSVPTGTPSDLAAATKQESNLTSPLKSGTYKIKNTQLEQAINDYNNAIEQIHNHFGQWKLTADEVERIKPELGIDLDKLTANIQKYQNGANVKEIGDNANWRSVVGLNNHPNKLTPTGKFEGNTEAINENAPSPNVLKNVALNQGTTSTSNTLKVPYIKGQYSPFDETAAPTQKIVPSKSNGIVNIFKHPLQTLNNAYTRTIDINHPLKAVDENTYIKATNAKNTGAIVNSVMNEGLVNRQGKKIGVSFKQLINDNIPSNDKEGFWEYVLQKHNIDRAKEITDDEGKIVKKSTPIYSRTIDGKEVPLTSEQSAKRVAFLEKQHPEWKAKADNITGWIDNFMNEWGVNSGIVDSDLYDSLRETYKNYVPTQRDFTDLESVVPQTNGRGFIDQNVPLKKVQGSTRDIKDPTENIMNLVNRTVRTAKYNEVGQDLLKAIRKDPQGMAQYAEIIPEDTEINPNVNNIVTVLENGKKVNIQINKKDLLESLNQLNKYAPGDIQKAAKAVTNKYKALITTKNPLFAARNIARDIPTAYINGSENNPIKFTKNLLSAGKDLLTNNETAQQYHGIGGGGSNFLYSGDNAAKAVKNLTSNPNILQKLNNGIEKLNDITESAPRLAEYKNVLKKTGDINKALYAANDITTNFSRGGDITKKVDSFVPYLNAGLQGLDKVARQFKDHPIQTTAKGIAGITLPTLAFDALNKNNPNYQQLDNRTKDNYYLIPNGDTFIKIPKSREFGVLFGSLAERLVRQANGEQNAFKGFFKNGNGLPGILGSTVGTNIAPSNPIENNLLSPLAYNVPKNKDFANRTIVPQSMQSRSPQYQYDETTSEIAKKIGQLANLSPKQVDYVIKSYTGVLGQLGLPMTVKQNYQGNPANIFMKPVTTNFTADPLYSNQALTDFYDNYDKAQQNYSDYKFTNGAESETKDKLSAANTGFANVSKAMSYYSKLAQQASLIGNTDLARKYRAQMIQLAQNANNGQFLTSKDLKELEE